jgi:hypothetical protein
MMEHNSTKQKKEPKAAIIAREERWWDIYAAVVGGGRYHDIANAMNIGTATVKRAVDWCMAETAKTRGGPASERLRNLYNDRYERLFLSVFSQAVNGNPDALDKCIRLLASLRKMNGADVPDRVVHEISAYLLKSVEEKREITVNLGLGTAERLQEILPMMQELGIAQHYFPEGANGSNGHTKDYS